MNPGIQLIIGCTMLSLIICYAWWSKVRVWILRQELFLIRDTLWDQMRERGTLDNPEYVDARDAINAAIRLGRGRVAKAG